MLLFLDSFDHYDTGTIVHKWTSIYYPVAPADVTISANAGRHNTDALRLKIDYGAGIWNIHARKTLGVSRNTLIMGFAFKITDLSITEQEIAAFRDGDVTQVLLKIGTDGCLRVYRKASPYDVRLGATGFSINEGQMHYIEWKVTFDSTAGIVDVRVDGAQRLYLANQNTVSSGQGQANSIQLGGLIAGNPNYLYYDDLYVCDTLGDLNNSFLGDVRACALFAGGPGNYTQWTPLTGQNYQMIDDPDPDGDVTYNSALAPGKKDSFAFSDLPAGLAGIVKALQVLVNARKDDAGTRQIAPFLRIGSADYTGGSIPVPNTYAYHVRHIWEVSPATAVAFTTDEINALEPGYELGA